MPSMSPLPRPPACSPSSPPPPTPPAFNHGPAFMNQAIAENPTACMMTIKCSYMPRVPCGDLQLPTPL